MISGAVNAARDVVVPRNRFVDVVVRWVAIGRGTCVVRGVEAVRAVVGCSVVRGIDAVRALTLPVVVR